MNRLTTEKRSLILRTMVEGTSIRGLARITGHATDTIMDLLVDAGTVCAAYQRKHLRNLTCKRLEVDEIWAFIQRKQKRVPDHLKGTLGIGDAWTFLAIDADTKLVPAWHVGKRDGHHAKVFVRDLAERLRHRVQLTTDGINMYLEAVEDAFGADIDYAMLVKHYDGPCEQDQRKYSPTAFAGADKTVIQGEPNMRLVSTSYIERMNLTIRMHGRRHTRLTNAHSKKLENHKHAMALTLMWYNFGKIHETLRMTPAMAAGVSDHIWEMEEIVGLIKE